MTKKRMGINRAVFSGLLASIVLAVSEGGCAGTASGRRPSEGPDPFFDDHVAIVRIVMTEEDWSHCLTNVFDEEYVKADFWFDDELVPDVGVRPKGNSTLGQAIGWGSSRIPLCVDFNLFNRARNFRGVKKVVLNNGWADPTLIRECLAYEIFAQMDIPTPRSSLVDVWVNDNHLGVYTMAEAIDASFISRHFDDATGNLYKPGLMSARLDWTEEDLERQREMQFIPVDPDPNIILYTNLGGGPLIDIMRAFDQLESNAFYTPTPPLEGNRFRGLPPFKQPSDYLEAMALKTNENNPDHSALFHFLEVLNNEPDETFPQEIEKVLDVDETLRFLAVSVVILHLDNYIGNGHNNYLYEENGVFHILPWDLNMAFGTFNCGIRKGGLINYYIDEPTSSRMERYPLVDRLLSHQPYMDKYHEYIQELLDGPFSPAVMISRIDQLADLIRPYAEVDTEKFYSTEDCERCLTQDLRQPDIFEGWQAGGAVPQMPWLSAQEMACLRKHFDISNPRELFSRELAPADLKKIKSCLSERKFSQFMQSIFGPLKGPQPPQQPGFGPNALGLKPFVVMRHESVRQQLSGERPSSAGNGSGNGVAKGMCAGGF